MTFRRLPNARGMTLRTLAGACALACALGAAAQSVPTKPAAGAAPASAAAKMPPEGPARGPGAAPAVADGPCGHPDGGPGDEAFDGPEPGPAGRHAGAPGAAAKGGPGCGPWSGPFAGPAGGPAGGPMPGPDGVPPYLRGIDLSEAQRDKIFALTHAQVPTAREQFKALEKAQRELRALVFQGPYDEAKARALADAAGRAQTELALSRARTDAQILQVLTPEQRKQFDDARPEPAGPQGRSAPGAGKRPPARS